jgi:DNA-binding response OmpR family regulator
MNVNTSSQTRGAAHAAPPGPAPPPRWILVVEDDGDIRRLNTEALAHYGYRVDAAQDGAMAWDALQLNGYDLMVTDNEMPKATGIDLLKKLHAAGRAVPVIMATRALPVDEFTRYPWLQPAAMLIKPYTIGELVLMVREVLHEAGDSCVGPGLLRTWQNQPSAEDWWKLLHRLRRERIYKPSMND